METTYFIYKTNKITKFEEIVKEEKIKVGEPVNTDSDLFNLCYFVDSQESEKDAKDVYNNFLRRHPQHSVCILCKCEVKSVREKWSVIDIKINK